MNKIVAVLILGLLVSAESSAKNVVVAHDPVAVTNAVTFAGSFEAGMGTFRETWRFTLDQAGSLRVTDAVGRSSYVLIGNDHSRINLTRSPLNTPITLSAGSYMLDFSGNAKDDGAVSLTATVAPVPEPASYAMFLAGIGVIAAVARRRARPIA